MKVAMITLICVVLSFVVIFFASGFIADDYNPSNWPTDGRFFFILTSLFFGGCLSAVFCNLEGEKNA